MNATMVAALYERLKGPWRIAHIDEKTGAADIEDADGTLIATVYPRGAQAAVASLPQLVLKLLNVMNAVNAHISRWERCRAIIYGMFRRDSSCNTLAIDPFYRPHDAMGVAEAMRSYPTR